LASTLFFIIIYPDSGPLYKSAFSVTRMSSSQHRVHVRVKPTTDFASEYIKLGEDGQSVTVKSLKEHPRSFLKHQISSYSFRFASILQNADQQTIFGLTTRSSIDSALAGTPGCIISCGGPSSGKTYTLNGPNNDYANRGVIPRAISYVFQKVLATPELGISVGCSYIEFLNEQLFDVLNSFNGQPHKDLKIVEMKSGYIGVKNLLIPIIKDEQAGLERLFAGNAIRSMSSDHLQTTSVFTLWFNSNVPQPNTSKPLHSKIHFVDMATPVKFNTFNRESEEFHKLANINKTMTVLERVLIAEEHIPYRSCPLTHFLKDSLPNRCLVAHVSFDTESLPATLGTLKFSARVQGETSDDILNLKEHKESQIKRLQKEVEEMRNQLRVKNSQLSFCEPDRQERQILTETASSYLSDAVAQFPIRSLYEIRASLQIMKELYRSQKVSAEEQLREKFVFTLKPPEPVKNQVVVERNESIITEEVPAYFPIMPTERELWVIYKIYNGEVFEQAIKEKHKSLTDNHKKLKETASLVNSHKEKIDSLKGLIAEKETSRMPPLDGVLIIDEDELKIREELRAVKKQYKEVYSTYCSKKDTEEQLIREIADIEEKMKDGFNKWLENKRKEESTNQEEEEESEELMDRDERKERRDYQRVIELDPKAGPYFFAGKKIQKILEREFKTNGKRRQPVTEEQ